MEQMNDLDDSIPSTVTRKRRRRSGLKFSTEKALKCSREARLTAKARGHDFSSVTKNLAFSDRLLNERCTADLQDDSSETDGPEFLEPIEKIEEDKNESCLGIASLATVYPEQVRKI
jgi:hypothetical protein